MVVEDHEIEDEMDIPEEGVPAVVVESNSSVQE
jgi:hypothetical protein